jgi:Tfp pilus assembly major pilin PilA
MKLIKLLCLLCLLASSAHAQMSRTFVASGATLPVSCLNSTLLYHLTQVNGSNSPGVYRCNGSTYVSVGATFTGGTVATAMTAPAFNINGTGGNGFLEAITQSSNPAAPSSGFRFFANSSGSPAWRRASDGFVRNLVSTLTADRNYTLPDASMTFARSDAGQTLNGANVFASQSTAQVPVSISLVSGQTGYPLEVRDSAGTVIYRVQADGGAVSSSAFNGTFLYSSGGARINGNIYTAGTIKYCHNSAATVCDQMGTGTPEGAITASVGSTFRRTDGGASTTFYVKESGTGNTGWIAK